MLTLSLPESSDGPMNTNLTFKSDDETGSAMRQHFFSFQSCPVYM